MTSVLVLGGGGVIGVAWELGIALGLAEAGFDPRGVDAIVGTSAGAIIGAQLAAGRLPLRDGVDAGAAAVEPGPPLSFSKLDPVVLGQVFKLWRGMELTTPEQAAAIGQLARGINRQGEQAWVASIGRTIGGDDWPELRMLIVAVDTETGQRRVFDRHAGVPLSRAVAASSAVPGMFPSVSIKGRLYMDGQVHSSTNADLLLPDRPARVLIAMPTNAATARGIGRHAERMLAAEVRALHALGCEVSIKTPSAQEGARLGGNLMDPSHAAEAQAMGMETGSAWARELA